MIKAIEFIFGFYISCIRPVTSFIIYLLCRPLMKSKKGAWSEIKNLSIEQFSEIINSFDYKADPFRGAIDFTIMNADVFLNENLTFGRDCDDFARMYFKYAKHKGYNAWEIFITDCSNINSLFMSGHAFTVIEKDGKYLLCNYSIEGKYSSIEDCIQQFEKKILVSCGKYKKLIYKIAKINEV